MGAVSAEAKEKKRLYDLQWKRENREKTGEWERRYALAHPDAIRAKQERRKPKVSAWQRADREANPEKYRERFREWYANNADKNVERQRAWRAANRASLQAQSNRRRARLLNAPGRGVTREQWQTVLDDYGHLCAYCARAVALEMDHIEPLSKGGAHDIDNVAPACSSCNASKNNRTLIVWLAVRAS